MMKIAQVSKTALSKVAPTIGKTVVSTAVKLPLTLAKLTTGILPIIGSVVLGGIYLLIKSMK